MLISISDSNAASPVGSLSSNPFSSMEVAVAPPAAVANSKTTIRVCTHFFKGNKVCLQRCIRDNGWLEETEEASGRSVYMWYANVVFRSL